MSAKTDRDETQTARRRPRFGRVQKTVAIVPLALLSAAWTASLTGVGVSDSLASSPQLPSLGLPDGAQVPSAPIEAPASVSSPDQGSPTYSGSNARQIVSTASTNDIPSAALNAYQRAAQVIDAADKSCNLSWQLIAAIGRVESNHGRANGSTLTSQGIAKPSIYGVRLKIADTDGGQIDGESGYDRAVGPMQFIPSTWQTVAVDADNDGVRDPQDINDAALGTAVYLCSGEGDLSTTAAQRDAVYRYNHSTSYVNLVLAIADAYLNGDFMTSPNDTLAGGYLTPLPPSSTPTYHAPHRGSKPNRQTQDVGESTDTGSTDTGDTGTDDNGDNGNSGNNGNDDGSSPSPSPSPTPSLPHLPKPPKLPKPPHTGVKPVDDLLTGAQAALQCTLDGYVNNILVKNDPFDRCVVAYTTTGKPPSGDSQPHGTIKH